MKKVNHYWLLTTAIKRKAARARTLLELNRVVTEIHNIRSHLAGLRWEIEKEYDERTGWRRK